MPNGYFLPKIATITPGTKRIKPTARTTNPATIQPTSTSPVKPLRNQMIPNSNAIAPRTNRPILTHSDNSWYSHWSLVVMRFYPIPKTSL